MPNPEQRHIIHLMVEMTIPQPTDLICDPACGLGVTLLAAADDVRERFPNLPSDASLAEHFRRRMFHGFDAEDAQLCVARANLLPHGVESPNLSRRDVLAHEWADDEGAFSLVLSCPSWAGSLRAEQVSECLRAIVDTNETPLLYVALALRLLQPGGQAAILVPESVLAGTTAAHERLRRTLVEGHKLDGVVTFPRGVLQPQSDSSAALVVFTKTNGGGTDYVWFYDVQADGRSLDARRAPLVAEDKLGPVPRVELSDEERAKNNLPDVLRRWRARDGSQRDRHGPCFCVDREEIASRGYILDLHHYREKRV